MDNINKFNKVSYFIETKAYKKNNQQGWTDEELKYLNYVYNNYELKELYNEHGQLDEVENILNTFGNNKLLKVDYGLELIKDNDRREEDIKYKYSPWNNTDKYNMQGVMDKLSKYPIGAIVEYYASSSEPKMPYELILNQIICTIGGILAGVKRNKINQYLKMMADIKEYHKKEIKNSSTKEESKVEEHTEFDAIILDEYGKVSKVYKGPDRWAKVVISTIGGDKPFTTNIYALTLAGMGQSKDMFEYTIDYGNGIKPGTKEGMIDACKKYPNAISEVQELKGLFPKGNYSDSILEYTREIYSSYSYDKAYSEHNGVYRYLPYLAPSLNAKTQNSTWYELVKFNPNMLSDGISRRLLIVGLDGRWQRKSQKPYLKNNIIKFNGADRHIVNIDNLWDLYRNFEGRMILDSTPKKLQNQYDLIMNKINQNLNKEELENMETTLAIVQDFITFIACKLYVIIDPKCDKDGKIIDNDDKLWEDVLYITMWYIQQSEKHMLNINKQSFREEQLKLLDGLNKRLKKVYGDDYKNKSISYRDMQRANIVRVDKDHYANVGKYKELCEGLARYGEVSIDNGMVTIVDKSGNI